MRNMKVIDVLFAGDIMCEGVFHGKVQNFLCEFSVTWKLKE